MEQAQTLFKELNLTQDQAQKAVDLYAKVSQDASSAPYQAWLDMQKEWKDSLRSAPEIGGKLPEVKRDIGRLIDGLGDAQLSMEFRETMDITGAGNHPSFVRVMYKLAGLLTEGKPLPAGNPATKEHKSAAQTFYPNLPTQMG